MAVNKRSGSPASRLTPAEQRKRFIETAREMGIPDTEAAQERAFGKVGLGKPPKRKKPTRRKQ